MPIRLRTLLRLFAFGLPLVALPSAIAGLVWKSSTLELTAQPGTAEAVGVYQFTNRGSSTITITNVQSGCSCTTTALAKRIYAPGESGEIQATLHIGQRVGDQEKQIQINTDDPAQPVQLLTLRVHILQLLTYTPRLLYWKKDELTDWKVATLTPGTALALTRLELVEPLPSEIIAEVTPANPGPGQILKIKPASPGQVINVTISGAAIFADGTRVPFSIYALVR